MNGSTQETSYRLLVIDDNRDIHADIRKILTPDTNHSAIDDLEAELFDEEKKDAGGVAFEISSAYQGQEGLALVQAAVREGRPYAVVIVDMRMPPGWDGLETIEHLWREDPNVQVVICSAYSDRSWSEMIDRLGTTDQLLILKKPFDNIEMIQAAHALSQKWALQRFA